jgi:hypothetical protein
MLYYKLSLRKSLKCNKPNSNNKSTSTKGELFIIAKTTN